MVGRWVDGTIVLLFDGPMLILIGETLGSLLGLRAYQTVIVELDFNFLSCKKVKNNKK